MEQSLHRRTGLAVFLADGAHSSGKRPPVEGRLFTRTLMRPLQHQIAFAGNLQEQRVAAHHRFRQRPRLQRPPDPPLPMAKVDRVMDPPRAVVAPEMVPLIPLVDSNRWKTDCHLAPLSGSGKEGAFGCSWYPTLCTGFSGNATAGSSR
jgi:hypothetical protein